MITNLLNDIFKSADNTEVYVSIVIRSVLILLSVFYFLRKQLAQMEFNTALNNTPLLLILSNISVVVFLMGSIILNYCRIADCGLNDNLGILAVFNTAALVSLYIWGWLLYREKDTLMEESKDRLKK